MQPVIIDMSSRIALCHPLPRSLTFENEISAVASASRKGTGWLQIGRENMNVHNDTKYSRSVSFQ
jgi:hypothetical protein